jgi:arylsulfatase
MPGASVGLHAEAPTIADLLKPLGYEQRRTPPRCAWLRRVFGKLYHLNAEEEPEDLDWEGSEAAFWTEGRVALMGGSQGRIEDTDLITKSAWKPSMAR